jgi:hypothetical protein
LSPDRALAFFPGPDISRRAAAGIGLRNSGRGQNDRAADTPFHETVTDVDEVLGLLWARFATISVDRRPGP